MIEEEDDEEILKKGVTFKSVIKNLFFISLIILGALFIYLGILPDQITSWSVGFMLICFGATLIQMQKSPSDPIRQTLTILICSLCGLTKVRNYEKGDFVFRKSGKCDKCDDTMEIKQIYSVRLKKPTELNKPSEDEKKEQKSKEKL
ncbi:MAG: hypothetical protein ACXABO_17525 [Promethearchaeota archaeon]|jgi:hypothetical protein